MRQLNLSHHALRKGLNTFACETTFRCLAPVYRLARGRIRGAGWSTFAQTTLPRIYETTRHGRVVNS